jgi:uncharacterized DUF497 family protein
MGKDVRYVIQDAVFMWDSDKAEPDLQKHAGISFQEACDVFFDPLYDMEEDAGVEGEHRWVVTGYSKANRPLCVVAVEQEDTWRIISARKLEPEERRQYEEEDDSY